MEAEQGGMGDLRSGESGEVESGRTADEAEGGGASIETCPVATVDVGAGSVELELVYCGARKKRRQV